VVAVVGDHGENIGDHGLMDHKMSVHATLLRVPLLLRYPPRVRGGARVETPVQTHDLFPTLLGLAGAAPPRGTIVEAVPLPGTGVEGASRSPHDPMIGEVAGPPVDFLQSMREAFPGADLTRFDRTQVSLSRDGWTIQWGSDGRHALYHVKTDPGETRDLAAVEPDRVRALAAEVEEWLRRPARRAAASAATRPR